MRINKIWFVTALLLAALFSLSLYAIKSRGITIVDAQIVNAIDEKLMPVKIMDVFPKDTSKVSCWIQWRNARINTQILAKWYYITDDIPILDYNLTIPKKEGMGSVTLSMPDGKNLPSGYYKIDLVLGKRVLKSLPFTIK